MAAEPAELNIAVNAATPVEAVATEAALAAGMAETGAHIEPVEAMTEAVLELCSRPQHELSGCVVFSLSLLRELGATAVARGGALHGVVANAGGGGTLASHHQCDTSEFLRAVPLNLLSTMLCVKHGAPALAAAGGGAFVAMSSIAAGVTHPHFGAYLVAKVAIETLIRNAADEYGRVNMRFNAVAPGFIETEIMEVVPRDSAAFRSYVDNTSLGGVGHPEDVAELVRFLIGPEARWITGETLRLDGGQHLRRGPDYSGFVGPVVEALREALAT